MAHTMTHTTHKNDAKEVTGYTIKADGVDVGSASKDEKGKFSFTPAWEGGEAITEQKTMRDLKAAVEKALPKDYVANNKPAEKPKPAKAEVSEAQAEQERQAIEAAAEGEAEDIDLD